MVSRDVAASETADLQEPQTGIVSFSWHQVLTSAVQEAERLQGQLLNQEAAFRALKLGRLQVALASSSANRRQPDS